MTTPDVIDTAAGLTEASPLFQARRFREGVVRATQASHDALLNEPVPGLPTADRLRVAVHVCEAAGAAELAAHYRQRHRQQLAADGAGDAVQDSPTLAAALRFAAVLTTHPRAGDQQAIAQLKQAGLDDAAIVALAQLVAFLSYQTRVVAGLKAMAGGSQKAPT